jgi:hypothetical protein
MDDLFLGGTRDSAYQGREAQAVKLLEEGFGNKPPVGGGLVLFATAGGDGRKTLL